MAADILIDHYARAYVASAATRGVEIGKLCSNPPLAGERFGERHLAEISRNVKVVLRDELGGLTPNPLQPGTFQMMCELATLSDTLGDALDRAFRFYALMTADIGFSLRQDGDRAIVTIGVADPCCDPSSILPEWWLLFWQRFGQWLIGEEIVIRSVDFRHRPVVEPIGYFEVLGANCRFEAPVSQLQFNAAMLGRTVIRDVADLERFLSPHTCDLVSVEGVEKGLTTVVRAHLRAHLRHHQSMPKLEVLARDFGMCGQTLRRRLDADGISYREIKAEVRREVAIRCLTDAGMPIREISLRSGFAEPNGLSRALRSWAGVTPTHYREMMASRAGEARA